ncbi:VENN motif pre-toxin domain-containing protein, partial [Erwinia amylovora]|uniref:VENN motif pre-toxin domain-containing protein n=1 Tax=Erwinia amylovora TaxID=552 RepID=UPI001F03FC33
TAAPDKNRLDTGSLGFGDIENKARYQVEHLSESFGTGGNTGLQFLGNAAGILMVGVNGNGHDSSTTKAAVSDGSIIIRDASARRQDVAGLSRDVEHANQTLSPIFNKEKEQQRLQEAQKISEIALQAADIAATQGKIKATRAANDKIAGASQHDRDKALAELKKQDPSKQYSEADIENQVYQNFYHQALTESGFGTGGKVQQAIQAATAAVQGLAGGNIGAAIAGGAAPYLAEVIHKMTEDKTVPGGINVEANLMAHAVVGAVVAQASGHSALAGAAGATAGEFIAQQLYPGTDRNQLTEEQKQTVSTLGTLAAGLAGGLTGGSAADTVAGAQAGKNAVENNALGDIAQAQSEGKTPEQKAGEYVEAENERYKKANCGGMSAQTCSVKMYEERREALKDTVSLGADFVPVVGDIKSFAEAQSALDYLAAAIGIIPGAGDAAGKVIRAAETALKKGDVAEASKLINEGSQQISAKAKEAQIWTETKKKEPVSNAYGHWDKHKQEFPEFHNSKQYVEATHSFVNNPPSGTLSKVRPNGETVFYNPKTNTFAVKTADGVPKTMFRPDPGDHGFKTNLDYFNAQ